MSINGEKIRKELSEGIPQIPLEDLRTLQSDYPYFQAIRFLYLKRVQKEEPLLYPEALERNAIYSGDRKSLFFLLEGARQSWTSLYRQNIESEKSKESFSLIDSFLSAQNENFSESIEQLIFQTGGIPATGEQKRIGEALRQFSEALCKCPLPGGKDEKRRYSGIK